MPPASTASPRCSRRAERPLIIVGAGALARPDGAAVAALAAKAAIELGAVKEGWNGYCVLHTAASRVGALEIGFVPGEGALNAAAMAKEGALDVLFLLGADEIDVPPGAFVVYIGTHGDNGAHRADVILPGAAYPEKSGLYVNTEGRVQMCEPRELPAGRCPRGLVDPARAVRSARARSCPMTRWQRCARRCSRSGRSLPASGRSWRAAPPTSASFRR